MQMDSTRLDVSSWTRFEDWIMKIYLRRKFMGEYTALSAVRNMSKVGSIDLVG